MQLKHIKLSGFKSFVDSTKITFPTNLVGVVGPNGCGKSNVIDAVKWVLGELSAKNLRGDSMVDVIFNGSDKRKASGQCTVELLFDNSMGKIGGEYASFNEISIKRSMTRDGISDYFINNTKCRRKDVQDIFLGTGLGPNSYAIIEQGMVSNLVGAKPEELRVHIEEAAGVSKYRERRKETESRIKRTKENLSRVKDIRDEIARLIRRLEGQAKAAEKYQLLKKQENETEIDISVLFLLEAQEKRDELQKIIDKYNRDYKIKEAETQAKQAQIDEFRTQNESVISSYEEAQKKYYSIGAEIARLEQNIHNAKSSEDSLKEELDRVEALHQKTIEKNSNFENLTPKEKALHILDEIILSIPNDTIKTKTIELKELLLEIFDIASAQTKSIQDDYMLRKSRLTNDINSSQEIQEKNSLELKALIEDSALSETELNKIRQQQSKVDAEVRELERDRSMAELDLRTIAEKISNNRVELK